MASAPTQVSPLQHDVPIVFPHDGTPTPQFILQLQLRLEEAIQAAQDAVQALQVANAAVPQSRVLTAGVGLSGGGDLTANRTFDLEDTAVIAGIYGDVANYPIFEVDDQGRLIDAGELPLPAGGGAALNPCIVKSGDYVWPATMGTASGNVVVAANTIYFFPFAADCVLSHLATEIVGGIAASNVRMAMYTNGANNKPDQLIEEAAMQATVLTGIKDAPFAANRTITDIVWIATLYSHAVTVRRGTPTTSSGQVMGHSTTNVGIQSSFVLYTAPFAFAAFPADTSALVLTPLNSVVGMVGKVA